MICTACHTREIVLAPFLEPQVPHLGVYGEDYTPCLPFVLVKLPASTHFMHLPSEIKEVLAAEGITGGSVPGTAVDLVFAVHPTAPRLPSSKLISTNDDEVNLMFHAWCFGPDVKYFEMPELVTTMKMGVFQADGARPIWLDLADGGVPFDPPAGKLRSLKVVMHDGRFSPANAMFQTRHDQDGFVSMYSVGVHAEAVKGQKNGGLCFADPVDSAPLKPGTRPIRRAVVCLHVQSECARTSKALEDCIDGKLSTVRDLIGRLETVLPKKHACKMMKFFCGNEASVEAKSEDIDKDDDGQE